MSHALSQPTSRREARRNERRDAIIAVAAKAFLEHGYAGTTMSAVADAVGGSKGTLWSHFSSKEELFTAVIDRLTADFHSRLFGALQQDEDVASALRAFCLRFIARLVTDDSVALFRLSISEAYRTPAVGQIFHQRGPLYVQQKLKAYMKEAMARGQLLEGDPLEAARELIALCLFSSRHDLLLGVIDGLTSRDIAKRADRAVSTFMRAYRRM